MKENTQTVTICLSHEELLRLLQIMNIPGLPGMDESSFENINKETMSVLISATERAMMARSLIVIDEHNNLLIDRGILAAISVCAYPEQMVTLLFKYNNVHVKQCFFYHVKELNVKYMPSATGLYKFEIASASDMGLDDVHNLLLDLPSSDPSSIYSLDQNVLIDIINSDYQDLSAIITRLTELDVPSQVALSFAQALSAPRIHLILYLIYRTTPIVTQRVLTVVANPIESWLLQTNEASSDIVTLQRLPATQIIQIINEAYLSLKEIMSTTL